ncbi:MAG: CHAT domain-containing protein [Bryobacterales bacterium]|nr:CHAT domain-containing protein [Bryobacterales bacterium]
MARSVTLHVVAVPGNAAFQVNFYEGAPLAAVPAGAIRHSVAVAAIGPGALLDTDLIQQTLATPGHSVSDLKRLGETLAEVLLQGDAGQAWRAACEAERLDGNTLRTHLFVPDALQALPWEFCRIDDDNVFFNAPLPLVRVLQNPLEPEPSQLQLPLRVLAVAGVGGSKLNTVSEVRQLRHLLREHDYLFDLEVFNCERRLSRPGSLVDQLKQELDAFQPHVLHFAGHAAYGAKPFLQLGSGNGPGNLWTAEGIGTYLGLQKWKLRFVFLNACSTQRTSKAATSFLNAFLNKGRAYAAVALCADADGAEAAAFSAQVYRFLAGGHAIDEAVAMARAHFGPDATTAAYYPVVSARVTPEALSIPVPVAADQARSKALRDLDTRKVRGYSPGRFVDRGLPRRTMLEKLTNSERVVLVHGSSENGKSWFLQSCRRLLAWRGWPLLYCDLENYQTWRDLLIALLSGGDRSGLGPVLDPALVKALTTEITQSQDLIDSARRVLDAIQNVTTVDVPAVLLIDQLTRDLSRGLSNDWATLRATLIDPIANGDGRIRAVIACAPDVLREDTGRALLPEPLELQPFPAHEIADLVHALFAAREPTEQQWTNAQGMLTANTTVDLSPSTVANWVKVAWEVTGGKPDA